MDPNNVAGKSRDGLESDIVARRSGGIRFQRIFVRDFSAILI
jgi:hypothetical protein